MENQELQIIDSNEFRIEKKKATSIESSFLPKKIETDGFLEVYNSILTLDIEDSETSKKARELRLKLVKVRTGISEIHKTEKAFFLASGKYVDALKNKLTATVEQMEEKLSEIEKYQENKEKERKAKLKEVRLSLLLPYEVDVTFVDIENMGDDQFDNFLNVNKAAYEAKIEAERIAEEKRIEEEKLAELKRIEEEKAKEAERIRLQEENIRIKKEREDLEKKQEEERKKKEKELLKFKQEAELKQKEQEDILRKEREKAAKIEAELKKEREEKDRKQAEEDRLKQELLDKQIAEDRAKLLAPDKEKISALYLSIKNFEFPEVKSKETKEIVSYAVSEFETILKTIVEMCKKLK